MNTPPRNPAADDARARIMEAFGPPAELHPDLKPHLTADPNFGTGLRHPLVNFPIYQDALTSHANRAYEAKQKRLAEADAGGEFIHSIFLHERPWRLQALMERIPRMKQKQKGELIGEVWRDSEEPHVNLEVWRELWLEPGAARHAMDSAELEVFADLKHRAGTGTLTLWRGTGDEESAARGLSWTTDRDKAAWFARRWGRQGVVWEVRPPANRLLAYLAGRGEFEVILDAKNLRGLRRAEGLEAR